MVTIDIFRHESEEAKRFAPGQVIFKEGDPGHELYVVIEGTVRASVRGRDLADMGPGEVLGEMALVGDHVRSATITAASECRLIEIGEKRFEFLVRQHPRFALQLMRVLADRLKERTTPAEPVAASA